MKINIEFASVNPTGPMHVGHLRGAVLGSAIANLQEFAGDDVTREYYVNDHGQQIIKLVDAAYYRYLEALGETPEHKPTEYNFEYMIPVGEWLRNIYGDWMKQIHDLEIELYPNKPVRHYCWYEMIRTLAVGYFVDRIQEELEVLGVKHDRFFYESKLHGTAFPDNLQFVMFNFPDLLLKSLQEQKKEQNKS